MIERRFGDSGPFSLGVEEELMLLDAETLEPAPVAEAVIDDVSRGTVPGELKKELFAAVLETATPVCAAPAETLTVLVRLREAAAERAAARGARIAAVGAHPFSPSTAQAFSDDERYRSMIEFGGPTTRRQNVCGLHVHVGMPTAEICHRVLEALVPWLPVVLAVSANSPFLDGEPNGLVSNRAEALSLLYRSGAPPAFRSYVDWERYSERMIASGVIDGYTRLWWDVRPHPHYGTIEIRMPDQPTSVRRSAAFAALLQALCATLAERPAPSYDPARRGDYVENRWRALRFGPRADLIHPDGDRLVRAADLAAELFALAAPEAERLGGADLLDELDPGSCEADDQLAAGDARAAAAFVADRSVPSAA